MQLSKMINEELLQYLCCSKCKSDLVEKDNFLVCRRSGKKYKIKEEIPILIDLENLSINLQKQIKYFNREAERRKEYKLEEWQKSYIKRVEKNFILREGNILIDVGTGSGYIAVEMAKKGLKVIACDLTLRSLITLKDVIKGEHLENKLFLICCSAEDLPVKGQIADYLVVNAVLEHLPNENKAIEEMNRVCKENAKLMVTVPLKYRYLNPLFIPVNYIHDKRIGHLRRYDCDDLKTKFREVGFKITRVFYTGHFLKTMGVIFSMLFNIHYCDEKFEELDNKKVNKRYRANNICVCLQRRRDGS